jgi:23S rRNA (cytosine1962-C5)-methyltransferase
MERITLTTQPTDSYELIDSGAEEKLERYGEVTLARPDPQALWEKLLPEIQWQKADAVYVRAKEGRNLPAGRQGEWEQKNSLPAQWQITFGGLEFIIRATSFKHTGLFPEQLAHWQWASEQIKRVGDSPKVLNLFGYTGGATLATAKAGAQVTHVDASKTAVAWARENAEASGLGEAPIRWIVEDALTFVKREIKRGNTYDAIFMDPPAFGHGPKGELWKIEEDFVELCKLCTQLLSQKPLFFVISGYAAGYSPLALAYNLEPLVQRFGGLVTCGDLTIAESTSSRLLPCGIFARWNR